MTSYYILFKRNSFKQFLITSKNDSTINMRTEGDFICFNPFRSMFHFEAPESFKKYEMF